MEIERIYAAKEYHGNGAAQALYAKSIAVAKEPPSEYVWMGAWEENPRAISCYKKNGVAEFDKHVFTLGTMNRPTS